MPEPQHERPAKVGLGDLALSPFDMRDALTAIALLLRDQEFEFKPLRPNEMHAQVHE